ncbi:MAG TPA: AI-2E family transporter [Candidatus Saccharimonadales bacterium]|nr:AI-2E family transporter [Candidatus Saccharimonadales bacterium]
MDTSAKNIYRILIIITSFILIVWVAVQVHRQLIWIGTAFFLAVALNPAVEWFRKHFTRGNRGLAITVTITILIAALGFIIASLVPPVVHQSQGLVNNLPNYTDNLVHSDNVVGQAIRKYDLVTRVKSDQTQLVHQVTTFGGSFFTVVRDIFSSLAATVTVFALTIFMLLEGHGWIEGAWARYHSAKKPHYQKLTRDMYVATTGYVNGNILTSIIAAITSGIMLIILGIPYAAPLAIFVGIMDLVPLVGATLGSIAVVIVALFQSVTAAVIMLIFFLVYQQTENHILQPLVYGKTVRISPLLVLVAVLIGAGLGGLLGGLVAIPVAASIQIMARDYLDTHHHQREA